MTLERSRMDRLGTAWVVPAARAAHSIADLLEEARALAAAERMASTCASWSVIGLWARNDSLGADELNAWRTGLAANTEQFRRLCETCPLTADGRIALPWPAFVEVNRAADFDVLLAAVTEPTVIDGDGPQPEEVVRRMRDDKEGKGRAYFLGNRSAGITTFQDLAILEQLERAGLASRTDQAGGRDDEIFEYLDRFLGYGPTHPRFVFVGLEERTDKGDEERNLAVRLSRPDLFGGSRGDKNRALAALYPNRRADVVPQWRIAAALVAEVRRLLKESHDASELEVLGTDDGDVFVAELLPVPRSGGSKFPWQRFALKGKTAYYRRSIGRNAAGKTRRDRGSTDRWLALNELMRSQDRKAAPQFVVCYGREWRAVYEQLVGPWNGDVQRELENGRVLRLGRTGRSTVVALTGFFSRRARNATDIVEADVGWLARLLVEAMPVSAPPVAGSS